MGPISYVGNPLWCLGVCLFLKWDVINLFSLRDCSVLLRVLTVVLYLASLFFIPVLSSGVSFPWEFALVSYTKCLPESCWKDKREILKNILLVFEVKPYHRNIFTLMLLAVSFFSQYLFRAFCLQHLFLCPLLFLSCSPL